MTDPRVFPLTVAELTQVLADMPQGADVFVNGEALEPVIRAEICSEECQCTVELTVGVESATPEPVDIAARYMTTIVDILTGYAKAETPPSHSELGASLAAALEATNMTAQNDAVGAVATALEELSPTGKELVDRAIIAADETALGLVDVEPEPEPVTPEGEAVLAEAARIADETAAILFTEWIAERPPEVQAVMAQLGIATPADMTCWRLADTGGHYTIHSFISADNEAEATAQSEAGGGPVELMVDHVPGPGSRIIGRGVRVFGIHPEDMVRCGCNNFDGWGSPMPEEGAP